MGQRFGGPFSPQSRGLDQRPPRPLRHPLERRTGWITAAAAFFLLGAFFQSPVGMVTDLAAFGIVAGAMWVTREGLKAEAAYDSRRTARRPAIPRKLFGAVLTGLGLAVGAWAPDAALGAGLIGIAGTALHMLGFGTDPMRDKGMEGVDSFQQDRAARMIAEGQAHLDAMKAAVMRTGERRLEARVAMFEATVQDLFRRVEADPGDLSAARRYLGIYLLGAREATAKFADLYAQTRDPRSLADWERLLTDLEGEFAARTRTLIEGGRSDLDIAISVLRDRLAREGVRTEDGGDPTRPALESRDDPLMETVLRDLDKTGKRR